MDLFLCNNPDMDIAQIIAKNLNDWMKTTPALDTIEKLASKAQIGFGTVRRAKNGDGNITVRNLDAIAHAFGRKATDLLADQGVTYKTRITENIVPFTVQEPCNASARELMMLAEKMSEDGRWQLVGQAKLLASMYPATKPNISS